MNWWPIVVMATLLMCVIGCGGGPSEAEIAALRADAAFWKGLGWFIGVIALVIGVIVGVSAAKRGESSDQGRSSGRRDDNDPSTR